MIRFLQLLLKSAAVSGAGRAQLNPKRPIKHHEAITLLGIRIQKPPFN